MKSEICMCCILLFDQLKPTGSCQKSGKVNEILECVCMLFINDNFILPVREESSYELV